MDTARWSDTSFAIAVHSTVTVYKATIKYVPNTNLLETAVREWPLACGNILHSIDHYHRFVKCFYSGLF